ncbi:MAG TPA: NADH-quinone oxidoreductase subunit C [Micromonosporaceae bacterium]|nr:NADH-quinone oxidoreductase subunit C [Micromonosporaceae bacterium]
MSVTSIERVAVIQTSAGSYRRHIEQSIVDGWRFAGLHVDSRCSAVRTLLAAPDGTARCVGVTVEAGQVPTIVDLAPAAGWDEREAADLFGIGFSGHQPLRPLVHHAELDRWTVPVRGEDPYQVAVGPIHAGVIESGHFRFHVVGDRVLHLDARLFYKHRGLERAAEGTGLEHGMRYAARACAACAVSNATAYAHACEQALGLVATAELARARTILIELERTWNHLNDIAAVCAGVGLAAGNNAFAALTERARRLNAALTGHRFLFGTVHIGASHLVAGAGQVRAIRAELAALRRQAAAGWRELFFNDSLQDRLPDVGVVTADQARRLGTVGPAARAAGLAEDVRATCTRLAYGPGFRPVAAAGAGDVKARLEQRALELWQSFALLDDLLDRPLAPATAEPAATPQPIGIGRVESPRGATTCVVEHEGERIGRFRLRTGSFANWPSVAHAAAGNLLPDFPLINKSFELCYACVDR